MNWITSFPVWLCLCLYRTRWVRTVGESGLFNACRDEGGCVLYTICVLVLRIVLPTRIKASPESIMPDDKATSCLINVRGEENHCILGIIQEHRTWRNTSTENPWIHRERGRNECCVSVVKNDSEEKKRLIQSPFTVSESGCQWVFWGCLQKVNTKCNLCCINAFGRIKSWFSSY